ncbi:hypothetical protein DLD82_09010 [Methanospirillum stamsii]|uniref:Uncharacterized protein n=1 Tax=Methanospirillum stamsii TaxID=1277351 RepID=A0A2V2NDK9_9EURY|nr:hypothetical protein DLD82_09010 [Methanospirillum stamsii]
MHLLANQVESVTRVPSIDRVLRSLHHLRECGGKDRVTDSGQGTGHGSRKHHRHQRITGNATITGAMISGVPASRDSSEDTYQARPSSVMPATARFSGYHSNVTVSRSPTTMPILSAPRWRPGQTVSLP